MNGNGEGEGEYLSPAQLSPSHSQHQDYSLSEFTRRADANARHLFTIFCRQMLQLLGSLFRILDLKM